MKAQDLKTIETFIAEYGMKPGVSTPVGNQTSGVSSTKATTPATPAKKLDKGAKVVNPDGGEDLEIVDKVGNQRNPDTLVAKNKKGEFTVIDPDSEVEVKEEISKADQILKRKHKLKNRIKQLLRATKHAQQSEPIFEINFNSKQVAQGALYAPIRCGFEAETTWPNVTGGDLDDDDWLDSKDWSEVSDLINDQEGSRSVDRVEESYREWLMDTDYFNDAESEVISELMGERKDNADYLNDFASERVDETDVEEYKETALDGMDEDELAEYEDWDYDAWARQYVEEELQDQFEEWLEEQIRDNSEHWDDAWERAMEACDINRYMEEEYGSWYSLLGNQDIHLYNEEGGGGRDEIASMLEDWASNNSRSSDVRAGDYHSGDGVDNTYWRVEDDSSIEGEGTAAEIISPVYDTPAEMIKEMKSLFAWLDENEAETNSSTGLHITMSIAGDETETNKLKMALLLGDKYVAKQFGRERNSYSNSQMQNIEKYMQNIQNNIKDQNSLSALEDIIAGGISAGKFSSINFKDATNQDNNSLIEFRVAGGDDYHTIMDTIAKTVIRYGAVMQAGHDENAFRQDYVKALFRLLRGQNDITTDAQRKAQQMVDPATINTKVLDAFQQIAGKKHYTDVVTALSSAYDVRAQALELKGPQKEMPFEAEGDESEESPNQWRKVFQRAQKYFVRAFAMLASDVASGVNRAQPKAAQIAALRTAMKDFQMTGDVLWNELQKSEFIRNFPGDHHSKIERVANAVNALLKKETASAPKPAITVSGKGALLLQADRYASLLGDLFGGTKADPDAPAPTAEDFKIIPNDEIEKVKSVRYKIDQHNHAIVSNQESIDTMEQLIKNDPDGPESSAAVLRRKHIDQRKSQITDMQKEIAESQPIIDAFMQKHGFVPESMSYGSKPIGTEYRRLNSNDIQTLSQKFNIKFDVQESAFDKLPSAEQPSTSIMKRKHKLKNRIKHLLRATKQAQQGEPVFEINFNNAQVIKSALDAPVSCGFEAEVVFPDLPGGGYSEDEGFDYDDYNEDQIMDRVWDHHGSRTVEQIEDGFSNWMMDSGQFADLQMDVEAEMIDERMDDNSYIDTVLEDNFTDEEVEEYATEELDDAKQSLQRLKDNGASETAIDTVEREVTQMDGYNLTDWGRHMVTHEHEEMLREHIQEELRNNGESYEEAAERFNETYSIKDWAEIEYGSWENMLYEFDALLYEESSGGVEEVAERLTDWADINSYSNKVEAGEYHQGAGNTEQDYWRVEEDSSIDTDNGAGAEIISPVYSTPREMLAEMKSLFAWLEDEDAETNTSTGLHVTMSLTDGSDSPENPLKMALLLGDKYLLKQFGREFNNYAKSQQDAVMNVARRLEKKDNLTAEEIQEVEVILKRGINYNKFSSINFKDATNSNGGKLIEFRIGGGDDYHTKFDTAAKSAIRYAVTMQAGHDPEAYKKDYIKTIVKLVDAAKGELTDAERANLEKGAGLDLKQSVFLDLIKQYSSRDNYYDNLDLYNLATQGETHAAVKLLNMFFMQAHAGKIDINTRTKRAILTAFKEMEIKPSEYFDALEKQMADIPNKAGVAKTYEEIADGFNKLTGKTAPEYSGVPVLKVKHPVDTELFVPSSVYQSMKKGGDFDPATFKFIDGADARFIRSILQDQFRIKDGQYDSDPERKTKAQLYVDQELEGFKNKHGFVPKLPVDPSVTDNDLVITDTGRVATGLAKHPTKPVLFVNESAFDRFDKLPLSEQLRIISKVDKQKLDETWIQASKKLTETIEAEQDMAALLTAYGTPKKKKKKAKKESVDNCAHGKYYCSTDKKYKCRKSPKKSRKVKEGAVPDHNVKRDYAEIMSKPLLGSDIQAQMQAYFVVPDPSMIRDFREQISTGGKDVDLRPTFKAYAERQLHPKQQAQIAESKLNEYDDLNTEKQNLIKTISGLDATNEKEAQLLDRIYKLLNSERISTTIGTAFNRPLADETMSDAEKKQIMQDMTKIIGGLDSDYGSVNRFVKQLETAGSAVNIAELAKPLNSFANVFTDSIAIDAMTALATYGVGKKQKGPGEYALAILSEKIRLANGEGDLEVDGIGKVELKAALTTAGGRIGYGGGSQKAKRAVIDKYAQYIPTVINSIGGTGGSLGLSKFIPALNADLPVSDVNNQKIRRAIATELLQMDLEKFAGPVVEAIATKEDLVAIEDAYLRQNFEWYKDRDDFDALLLMHIPNRKTAMIKNADDLIKFRRSGHSNATSISVIPTQAGAGREQWAQLTLNKGTV